MGHICINCNSGEVTRQGDGFICGRCNFKWDVAHEQACAIYLRGQGREPAKSMAELEAEAAEAATSATPEIETVDPSLNPTAQPSTPPPATPSGKGKKGQAAIENTDGGANEPEKLPAPPVGTEPPTSEAGDPAQDSTANGDAGGS